MPILIKTFHVDLFFWKLDVFSASKTSIKIGSESDFFWRSRDELQFIDVRKLRFGSKPRTGAALSAIPGTPVRLRYHYHRFGSRRWRAGRRSCRALGQAETNPGPGGRIVSISNPRL